MAQENIGFIIEGLLKELASGVPAQTVLLEIQKSSALYKIFIARPRYQLIDSLQEKDLRILLEGFLGEIKGEISETTTEGELVQKISGADMAKQAGEAKAAALGHDSLENLRGRRRTFIHDSVSKFASLKTRQELARNLENLPLSASKSDVERNIRDTLSAQREEATAQTAQLTEELSQKQEDVALSASCIASAIAGHSGPRPDIFATILNKKIEANNPETAEGYKKIIDEAAPLSRVYEAVTSASEDGGHKEYFSLWFSNNPGSKSLDDRYKSAPGSSLPGSPKEHAEVASAVVSSAAERILKNPDLRKKLAPDEIELLKRIGERGFTRQNITATKWLAQLLTTPPDDLDFKKVNDSIFSMFELKRIGLLPTSAFSKEPPRQMERAATLVEKYTVWHPLVLFYATIAQTSPQELAFSPFGAGQWIVGWATQQGVEGGLVELGVGTVTKSIGARIGGAVATGLFTGGWGTVLGFFGTDTITRGLGRLWSWATNRTPRKQRSELFDINALSTGLVVALFLVMMGGSIIMAPVLTAFSVTSPYSGAGGTASGGPTTNANHTTLAGLGSFDQFNTNNVGGIYTSRGGTRPLVDGEQTKVAAAIGVFGSFALFGTPLGQTKINLTAFPTNSPDDVIGFSPPSQAGNIALYQNAFDFSAQTLGRLLAHELTHQIEWFRPDIYNAFLRGTTTLAKGYCGPLGTYIKSLPETSEETFAEASAMYITRDPRLKDPAHQGTCAGNTYIFMDTMFTKGT